jgi:aconitate hydratase
MGVLPLQFTGDDTRHTLNITGEETFSLTNIQGQLKPRQEVELTVTYADGSTKQTKLLARLDTADEVDYYMHGGILHYVLRTMAKN